MLGNIDIAKISRISYDSRAKMLTFASSAIADLGPHITSHCFVTSTLHLRHLSLEMSYINTKTENGVRKPLS